MQRKLSKAEVTAIGYVLLLVTGNDAITSQMRDVAVAYLRAKREQVRSLAYWWGELDLGKSRKAKRDAESCDIQRRLRTSGTQCAAFLKNG